MACRSGEVRTSVTSGGELGFPPLVLDCRKEAVTVRVVGVDLEGLPQAFAREGEVLSGVETVVREEQSGHVSGQSRPAPGSGEARADPDRTLEGALGVVESRPRIDLSVVLEDAEVEGRQALEEMR